MTTAVTARTTHPASFSERFNSWFMRVLRARETGIFLFTIYLGLFLFWYRKETFFSDANILQMLRDLSWVGMVAVGQAMVIMTGGIDLSVGSVVGFASVLVAILMRSGWPYWYAVPVTLVVGSMCGVVNGLLITRLRMPPFVPTLGMLSIARGLCFALTGGQAFTNFGPTKEQFVIWGGRVGDLVPLRDLGRFILLIPLPVIYMVVIALLGWLFVAKNRWGYSLYAIGGREYAARVVGIPVDRMKVIVYTLSALISAFVGIVMSARLQAAAANTALGMELDVISAVVIGGVSLTGGEGTIPGVFIASILFGLIRNGLIQLGVSAFWTQTAVGTLLILAVALDILKRQRLRYDR